MIEVTPIVTPIITPLSHGIFRMHSVYCHIITRITPKIDTQKNGNKKSEIQAKKPFFSYIFLKTCVLCDNISIHPVLVCDNTCDNRVTMCDNGGGCCYEGK